MQPRQQGQTTTVEATGVLFEPRSDDPGALVDAAGRQPVIDLTRRLRPASTPIDDKKLTPFLGYWGQLRPGQSPEAYVIKVIRIATTPHGRPDAGTPLVGPQASRLLANEEEAARRNGLLPDDVPATGVGGGYAWVVRRYIHGLTLSQTRTQGGLEGNRGVLARLLLARIAELHTRTYNGHPLFHGDIKPANVIVQVAGREITGVELIDYESGGATGDDGPAWRHATFQFASPEHFLSPRIDQASDVFSWGLTVLDMYAPNRHPFVGDLEDLREYEEAYGTGRPADEAVLACIVDPVVRECVRLALTVRSDERPSARALYSRLTAGSAARPAGPVQAPTTTFELPRRDVDDPDATALRNYGLSGEGPGGPAATYVPGGPAATYVPGGPAATSAPGTPYAPGDPATRVAPTRAVPVPLGEEEPPPPVERPRAGLPTDTADPDSVPAQLAAWWRQVFTVEGYLGAETFGPGLWAGYLAATVLAGIGVGVLVGVVLLALGRVLVP
ncbi:hypothetical protein [Raineyella fluvialis]|uniref:Protein kinase domain-containing protein n=1 Tax=Raineyella fluvialis TaxID=2662261 RepID=A0A5Q2FB85_9ACTN|nr:hypothetical protein [Raineyella fluvialis]QGF23661.1 hypothetical protein Rai3103_08240 [Raineyella fluvialis]